jgi:hypothetical protein
MPLMMAPTFPLQRCRGRRSDMDLVVCIARLQYDQRSFLVTLATSVLPVSELAIGPDDRSEMQIDLQLAPEETCKDLGRDWSGPKHR